MIVARSNNKPCFVCLAPLNRTRLFGKNWIFDAAQFGVQRLSPKSVVPTAPDRLHDCQGG